MYFFFGKENIKLQYSMGSFEILMKQKIFYRSIKLIYIDSINLTI